MCWLLVWSGTFRYQEKNERDFLAHQAIAVVKKMFYRVEQDVADLIILMMQVAFVEGTEEIVRSLRELYLIDLKLPPNQAVEQYNLRALGRGAALNDAFPDFLISQDQAQHDNQFNRMLKSLSTLERKIENASGGQLSDPSQTSFLCDL